MKNDICTLIFSKNRPLQLDLLLNSFYLQCRQPTETDIYIVYNYTDKEYENLYKKLIQEQEEKERNNIQFIDENCYRSFQSSFSPRILNERYEYIMFLVDDNIFTNNFSLMSIKDLLFYNPDVLGFSLRLGENTNYCYPLKIKQTIPNKTNYTGIISFNDFLSQKTLTYFAFDWTKACLDFAYALEISSSIYRIKDMFFLLRDLKYKNPNELEAQLYVNLWRFYKKSKLLSYNISVAFCAPMNKVQSVAPNNRFSGINIYSPENMLKMYKNGFRIDPERFSGFVSNGCHQEVELYTLEDFEKYGR